MSLSVLQIGFIVLVAVFFLLAVIRFWTPRPGKKAELKGKQISRPSAVGGILNVEASGDVEVVPVEPGDNERPPDVLFGGIPKK